MPLHRRRLLIARYVSFGLLAVAWMGHHLFAEEQNPVRNWKTANGKFQVEAQVLDLLKDEVRIVRKDNGRRVTVPLRALSKPDQAFVALLRKSSDIKWGKWKASDDTCKHTQYLSTLQMKLPAGNFVMNAESGQMNAPRIGNLIKANRFVVDVLVDGDFTSKAAARRPEYRGAGLYLMISDDSYLRLERASHGNNHYINFEKREEGHIFEQGQFDESTIDPDKPVWLRLVIDDGIVFAGYRQSENWIYLDREIDWEPMMLVEEVSSDSPPQELGVAASATVGPFSPTFRWLRTYKDAKFIDATVTAVSN